MAIQPSEAKPWMLLLFCGLFSSVLCAKDLEFTVELNNAAVVKGSSFIWDCAAEGALPIDITWRKDGQAIVNSEQHTILRNGSLYFTTIERKKQDEGVYECVASNIYGTIVSRANLFIASMSRFLEDPQPVTASLKGVARFRCYLDSIPQADISWEKDRLPIPFNNRFVVLPSGVLQIHDIQESDAANYRCIAVNIANKRRSAEAPLTVQSTIPLLDDVDDMRKPRLVSRSGSTQALAGKTVILECLFERYSLQDTPPEVTWTRGGQLLYTNKYSVYGRSNLRISDLVVFDSGTYVCTARNVETNGIVSVNIYLNVQAPPTLDMVPNGVTRPRASTARFTCICTVDSKPTPTITWLKDGRKIDISGRFNIIYDGLVIVNVQKNTGNETDEGLYQCIAENMYGRAQASARLIIEVAENSPNPPRNVAATVLSSTSVNVTWQAPIMNITVDILTYTIHYQLMEKNSRESDIIADEFDNRGGNLVIEDLSPFSSYMCYVLAYTSRGISPSSELVYFKMLEDVPSVAPTFTLSSNSPNIILIYWESIPSENRNGIIVSYKIFYRNEATTEQSVVELDSNLNYYLLNNLDGNTLYHIAMSASTNVGEGVKSEWSSRTTAANPDPTIPNAPVMELVQVNSSTVKVHWSMQLGNVSSPITGFKLYYASAKNEEHRTGPVMLPSNAMMYVLSGLSPSTRYFVELLAYNQIGDGRDATGYVETSDLSEGPVDKILPVPPYPNINNIVPLNSTAIYLSWDKPQTMLTIVCYTLRVTPLYTANATMVRRETSNLRQYVLNSLKPFTRYLIAIKAHTPTTESRFSLDESVDTPQDKPWSAPVNVLVKEHSTHSVVIQWSPPDLPNGIITRYIILYNVNTTLPEDLWDKDEKEGTVTKSIINNLQLGYEYYFVMKASTKVGEGPATAPIPFKMPGSYSYDINTEHPTESPSVSTVNITGILIGVSLGIGTIILCMVILICKVRYGCLVPCNKPSTCEVHIPTANGHIPCSNGNGHLKVELDSFSTPMLSPTLQEETSFIDTKGGNGDVSMNGFGPSGFYHRPPQSHIPQMAAAHPLLSDVHPADEDCNNEDEVLEEDENTGILNNLRNSKTAATLPDAATQGYHGNTDENSSNESVASSPVQASVVPQDSGNTKVTINSNSSTGVSICERRTPPSCELDEYEHSSRDDISSSTSKR